LARKVSGLLRNRPQLPLRIVPRLCKIAKNCLFCSDCAPIIFSAPEALLCSKYTASKMCKNLAFDWLHTGIRKA